MAGRSGESQPAWYFLDWVNQDDHFYITPAPKAWPDSDTMHSYWFGTMNGDDVSIDVQGLGRFILGFAEDTPEWPIFALIYDYD